MGPDTAHEEVVGRVPPQVGPQADRAATAEWARQRMVLPPAAGCDGRGGFAGGVDLSLPPSEHSSTIYCDQAYYGYVSSGKAEARAKGGNAVVGTGGLGFGGDMDGGPGGGADGEGGGDGPETD